MKSLIAPLACLAFTTAVIADPLARQYAAEIVRQNVKVPDTELEFTEWQQSVPGGYVLRFAFDVDGDGSAERFLASSFNAEKLVCEWTVYAGASGKLLGKGTSLRPDGFWWNPTTHEMLDYVRFGAEGGSAIFSQFSTNGLTTRNESAALDEVSSGLGSKEAPRQGFQRIKPDVTISLLADVVADADSGWRPLILDDAGHNYSLPNGRLLLTEDAPRVESLRSFTPKAAFAALQKSEPQSEKSSNKPPTTGTLPIVKPAPPPNASEAKPVAASEAPTSSTPWSVIVVLIVAATGLLWLLVKKRR
jgi:hypothetical protein